MINSSEATIANAALRATVSPNVGPTDSLEKPSRVTPNSSSSSRSSRCTPPGPSSDVEIWTT